MKKLRHKLLSDIGGLIRSFREANGWSQADLGDRLGLADYRLISELETGKRDMRLTTLERVAEALGVSMPELMPGKGSTEDQELSALTATIARKNQSERARLVRMLKGYLGKKS